MIYCVRAKTYDWFPRSQVLFLLEICPSIVLNSLGLFKPDYGNVENVGFEIKVRLIECRWRGAWKQGQVVFFVFLAQWTPIICFVHLLRFTKNLADWTKSKSNDTEITMQQMELIKTKNKLDVMLYAYAEKLFLKRFV